MKSRKLHGWLIYLAITFILLGMMISIQAQTQNRLTSDLAAQSTTDLTIMLKNLSDKRRLLNQEIMEAEQNLEAYQLDYADDAEIIERMNNELSRLKMLTGQVDVVGPGIKIVIQKDNLLYSDVVGIINELWGAGAEAIAINDIRMIDTTSLGYVDALNNTYITCDDKILESPYTIEAIGNKIILEKGLTMPGGIIDNLAFFKIFPTITLEDELILPALTEQKTMRYSDVPQNKEKE